MLICFLLTALVIWWFYVKAAFSLACFSAKGLKLKIKIKLKMGLLYLPRENEGGFALVLFFVVEDYWAFFFKKNFWFVFWEGFWLFGMFTLTAFAFWFWMLWSRVKRKLKTILGVFLKLGKLRDSCSMWS